VVVWNRSAAKAEALAAEGAQAAVSPAEVCRRAPIVLACLYDAAAVEAVVTGPEGVLAGIGPGQVFIDLTSNSPPVSQRLAALLAGRGAEMLDAPVSGGDVGALEGTLSIMAGGKPAVFERCRPILSVLGRRITLMGGTVGAGGYAKLANQIMVAAHLAAMGEALVFGAKAGLDLDRLVSALSGGMANSAVLEIKAEKVLSGNFAPGAESRVHLKDLTYIRQAMDALGIALPLADLLRGLYGQLVEAGFAHEDHSAIVRLFERDAGVEARR
jgi:2-hydroxy-3-oxopropionate reductase